MDPLRHWPKGGRGGKVTTKKSHIGTIYIPNHNPPSLCAKKDRQVLLLLGEKVSSEARENPAKMAVEGICNVRQKKRDEFAKRKIVGTVKSAAQMSNNKKAAAATAASSVKKPKRKRKTKTKPKP